MSVAPDRQIITERGDEITPRKLDWLWPQRIPLGKITLFVGLPGEGKSLATIDVAARVTTRRNYPDEGNPLDGPGEVLFISGEDDAEDALIPRLIAAGADLAKIHVLKAVRVNGQGTDNIWRLDLDMEAIRSYLKEHRNIRLIVIDPISNHLGSVSMIEEQQVRAILWPLKEFARVNGLAILCVMHLNKKEGLTAIQRVGGAGAFVGVSRASWFFVRDKETPYKHLMLPLKNNYARDATPGLSFRFDEKAITIEGTLVPTPSIEWLETTDMDANDALSAPAKRTSRDDAKDFLETFLAQGPQDALAVYAAAATEGISKRTLDRAKADLDVVSRKKGTDGWEWMLPNCQAENANPSQDENGNVGNLQPEPMSVT
jgi:AAA domain-containing protein